MPDSIMPCPSCGKNYNISTFKPGMKFRCTQCDSIVTVPGPSRGPEPESEPPRRRQPARRAHRQPDEDRDDGRAAPRKKDNTGMMVTLGITVAAIAVIGLVLGLSKGKDIAHPSTEPHALMSGVTDTGTPRPPDWAISGFSATPIVSGAAQNPQTSGGPSVSGSGGTPAPVPQNYKALKDCTPELQELVKRVVDKAGGADTLKFVASGWKMSTVVRDNLQHNPNPEIKDDPFDFVTDTEIPMMLWFMRSANKGMLRKQYVQSSLKTVFAFNGKDCFKFIDANKGDVSALERSLMLNETYDYDLMYKLSTDQFYFLDRVIESKYTFANLPFKYVGFKIRDRFDTSIVRQLFFYTPESSQFAKAEWADLLCKVTYEDSGSSQKINRYYWNYTEKKGWRFPLITLNHQTSIENVKDTFTGSLQMIRVFKEDPEEQGEIKIEMKIDQSAFESFETPRE
ncbi:MAG: hypothetical protein WC712_06670 [Candidatus Brocadiia bacterium]